MAYALVGSVGAASTGAAAAAVTPAYGQTPTANNLLILYVATGFTTTLPGTPAGWTLGPQVAGTLCTSTVFYKIAAGGDAAPTVAGIASTVISAQLAEFSGNATSSPLDQSGTATGTTTPIVATEGAADAAAGELVIGCASVRYSIAATETTSHTLNNGATSTSTNNDGTSQANHYNFTYGITTGKASADNDSFAFTTTNISGAALTLASFKLGPPASVYTPRYLPRSTGPRSVGPTFFTFLQLIPAAPPIFVPPARVPVYLPRSMGPSAVGPTFFAPLQLRGYPVAINTADSVTGALIFGGVAGDYYQTWAPYAPRYLPRSIGPAAGPAFFAPLIPRTQVAGPVTYTDTVTGALIFGGVAGDYYQTWAPFSPQFLPRSLGPRAPYFAQLPSYPVAINTADNPSGTIIFGGTAGDYYQTWAPFRPQFLPRSLGPRAPYFAQLPSYPVAINTSDSPSGAIIFGGAAGDYYQTWAPFRPQFLPRSLGPRAPYFAQLPSYPVAINTADYPIGVLIFGGVAGDYYQTWVPFKPRFLPRRLGPTAGPTFFAPLQTPGYPIAAGLVVFIDLVSGILIFRGTVIENLNQPPPVQPTPPDPHLMHMRPLRASGSNPRWKRGWS